MLRLSEIPFLERGETPGAGVAAVLGDDEALGGRRLVCRLCGRTITGERARAEIGGAHEHVKENPAGLVFRIGCFRAAPGCASHGVAVTEHTWFAGYTWQIALCGGCQTHLGWRFRAPEDGFYGLILDRLIEQDAGPHGANPGAP